MEKVDIVIIGAGVVGLSIAARLSRSEHSVYVLERHDSFGQEASSRNSEVIHSGVYYPTGSLKAKFCVEGNRMLYELCSKNHITYKRTEKLIVATNEDEEEILAGLLKRGRDNGVIDLKILSSAEVKKLEPNIKAKSVLHLLSTGIIDSHNLMKYFIQRLKEKGGDVAYNSNVNDVRKTLSSYEITVRGSDGEEFKFQAQVVINCAGLESDHIAQIVGIDIMKENYNLKYCKGQYFRVVNTKKCGLINRLIYPTPQKNEGGLGIHATLDLGHGLRLGPDSHYINREDIDYNVDISERANFLNSVIKFLPFLEEKDLIPDTSGIRAKLQGEHEYFRDFVIKEENDAGFPGFINLIGIESPGLTSAPAIAAYVERLAR
jgi:L-2-hydroxyglutarate oxidase LhgO